MELCVSGRKMHVKCFSRRSQVSDLPFTMAVYEKLYFEAYITNQTVMENNTVLLHFVLNRSQ